jgi:hypothetical protein
MPATNDPSVPAPLPSEDPQGAEQFAAAEGGTSILAKVKVVLFLVLVIAAECFLAWLYLPSASQTAEMAGVALGAEDPPEPATEPGQSSAAADDLTGWVEVDLGEFNVVSYQPVSGTALRVYFRLWGMVHENDYSQFLTLMEEHLHRFREQIYFTVRSAEIADLTDPRLSLMKRKTLESTNKILGKPLLRVVIFDNFSVIEQ